MLGFAKMSITQSGPPDRHMSPWSCFHVKSIFPWSSPLTPTHSCVFLQGPQQQHSAKKTAYTNLFWPHPIDISVSEISVVTGRLVHLQGRKTHFFRIVRWLELNFGISLEETNLAFYSCVTSFHHLQSHAASQKGTCTFFGELRWCTFRIHNFAAFAKVYVDQRLYPHFSATKCSFIASFWAAQWSAIQTSSR